MKLPAALNRLVRYGAIGTIAAVIHASVLLGVGSWLPRSLANPIGFLAASIAGYLGHALLTFREETGGRRFPRRWLLLQYAVNISVCSLLPLLDAPTVVLVFTPTVLNALIWNRAARIALHQRQRIGGPAIHADDLGLAPGVDTAILELATTGQLSSASLLVDGATAESAAAAWRCLPRAQPLLLHLCLTEGPQPLDCPDLPTGFGELLLSSLLPGKRRELRAQIVTSLQAQIHRFQQLTGQQQIQLDGHQHIHLLPLVLDVVLEQPEVIWVRTTAEPLPQGLPLSLWIKALRNGGLLKWMVLQALTWLAQPRLKAAGICTNDRFAGVLFTGQMTGAALEGAVRSLGEGDLLLAHPAAPVNTTQLVQRRFHRSAEFFNSPRRQDEWRALSSRAPRE